MTPDITVISSISSHHLSGYPNNYTAPSTYAKKMSDPKYPLYLDPTAYNPILDLHGSTPGLQSFATAIGLRDVDLFATSMVVFMAITAVVLVISLVIWILHAVVEYFSAHRRNVSQSVIAGKRNSSLGSNLEGLARKEAPNSQDVPTTGALHTLAHGTGSREAIHAPSRSRRVWLRFRPKGEAGAFHAAALYGNLLRLVIIFHFPVTAFSVYQLSLSEATIVSRVFAALALLLISVLIPAFIMWKIFKTPTGKLYDATRTLLSLGTMYNVYVEGKQMFRIFPMLASLVEGIVVGAGQKSGLAQAIVLVIVEMAMLILSAFWYPWGEGASMGAPSAMLGITRVVSLVFALLLSKEVSRVLLIVAPYRR